MPQRIKVGNDILEFPDGMGDDQIRAAIQKEYGAPNAPTDTPAPDSFGTRFRRGLAQPVVGAAQMMSRPLAGLGGMVNEVLPGAGDYLESTPQAADDMAAQLRADAKAGADGFDAAGLMGNIVGTFPLGAVKVAQGGSKLAPVINRAVQGGLVGGALSNTNDGGVGENAGVGAAASVALPPVLKGAAKVVAPAARTVAGKLSQQGIELTPGMAMGQWAKRAEDGLASIPLLGDAVKAGQRHSFESFNRAAVNKALEPVGKTLPEGITGREAIAYASDALGQSYDELLPKLRIKADSDFTQELLAIQNVAKGLPEKQLKDFNHMLKVEVLDKFTPHQLMAGETMKKVESRLGSMAKSYLKSDDPYTVDLGRAALEMQAMLRGLVERSNPQFQGELSGINTGWAIFKRLEDAAGRVTSEHGIFTPEALLASVKKLDPTKGKSKFARGDALLQDFAEPAREAMGRKVPDSGTAFRGMTGAGVLGAIEPTTMALTLPMSIPYMQGGRQVANAAMTKRPPGAELLAKALESGRTSTALTPSAVALSNLLLSNGP